MSLLICACAQYNLVPYGQCQLKVVQIIPSNVVCICVCVRACVCACVSYP